eukprot:47573-Chlamydomonas_euryale.AAC.1
MHTDSNSPRKELFETRLDTQADHHYVHDENLIRGMQRMAVRKIRTSNGLADCSGEGRTCLSTPADGDLAVK